MRRQHFSHALLMFWVVFLPLRNLCLVWRTNINIRFLIDKMSHLLFLRKHPVLQVKWVVNAVSFWFNCVRSQKLQKAENNVSSVCVPERPQTQKQTLWSCWHKCVSENHTHSDGHRTDPDANRRRCCVCVCVHICLLCTCVSVLPTQYVSFAMVRSPHVLSYSEIFPHERRQKGAQKTSNITHIEIHTHLTASGDSLSAIINR